MALPIFQHPLTRTMLAADLATMPTEVKEHLDCFYSANPSMEDQKTALTPVIQQCIKDNNVALVRSILRHGFPISTSVARQAVEKGATDILQAYIDNGWDINDPISETEPPVLGYLMCHILQACKTDLSQMCC